MNLKNFSYTEFVKINMITLGINYFGQPSSASIVKNGKLVFAIEEERLSRIKQDGSFPIKSINACLKYLGIKIDSVDAIGMATIPHRLLKEKYLRYTLQNFPHSNSLLISDRAFERMKFLNNIENYGRKLLKFNKKIFFYNHHLCHIASSHFLSGFKKSCSVSIDGLGEIESAVIGIGNGKKVKIIDAINYPDSIGLVYKGITDYLGFDHRTSQGTVMALAAYGNYNEKLKNNNSYYKEFKKIIKISKDGKFSIDKSYFNYPYKLEGWVSDKFIKLFGKRRNKKSKLEKRHKDIAAALQKRFEDAYLSFIKRAQNLTQLKTLTLSGGCALNCKANGEIIKKTNFKDIYIQPACGDNGLCIAAAHLAEIEISKKVNLKINFNKFSHTYFGPSFSNSQIKKQLISLNYKYKYISNAEAYAAQLLNNGKIIGWFQGRMEFGPRALGNRSILSAPFPLSKKHKLNRDIKHRESFRPFAPSIIYEYVEEYFDINFDSPFMLIASKATKKILKKAPAIIHKDLTSRIQTVKKSDNLNYYNLINEFYKLSGVPILLNTSFNDKGEPVVCNPKDAILSFEKTNLDFLIMGNYLIEKK